MELKLKEVGWTENSPAVFLVIDFKDKEVTTTGIYILGFQESAKLTGKRFNDKSYAKIEKNDYAEFIFPGRTVSEWLDGNRAD